MLGDAPAEIVVVAKRKGREIWYSHYMIRICKVEGVYGRPDG